MKKPARFTHVCDGCTYLGQHEEYDLYFCDGSAASFGGSTLARYGHEPPEYKSMPKFMAERVAESDSPSAGLYREILNRAQAKT